MSRATVVYNALIWELRKAIFARGLTMKECDDLSGNQDGYTAKMLHPDTDCGRQANWDSMERLVLAVFPKGFRLTLKPKTKGMPNGFGTIEKMRKTAFAGRLPIRDYAAFAGRRSWESRRKTMTDEQWSRHCRKAAKARWRKSKQANDSAQSIS